MAEMLGKSWLSQGRSVSHHKPEGMYRCVLWGIHCGEVMERSQDVDALPDGILKCEGCKDEGQQWPYGGNEHVRATVGASSRSRRILCGDNLRSLVLRIILYRCDVYHSFHGGQVTKVTGGMSDRTSDARAGVRGVLPP